MRWLRTLQGNLHFPPAIYIPAASGKRTAGLTVKKSAYFHAKTPRRRDN